MVKQEVSLTFYGGVNEIGGNKILLRDGDTRIFFDFGASFAMRKRFYSPPFLSPKTAESLQELGILPKLEGVYKFDEKAPQIDAIFISHAHLDHVANLSFVNRGIPIHCGETTKTILQTLDEIRRTDLEFDVEGLSLNSFRTRDKICVGNVTVEPVHVDHSVPGAYGFIIHTSAGPVIYTGDFRIHGSKPEMTRDFVEKAKASDPVAVVTEATNMTGASVSSESEVENKLGNIAGQTKGIMLAEFAFADIDRLNSFYRVAKKNGRCLALSIRQAYLLNALRCDRNLRIPSLDDESVLIFRKSKKRYEKWESKIADQYSERVVDVFELSKRQCKITLTLSFYDLEQLVDIKPEAGSCYVVSASEPFNEEMEMDFERLVSWLKHYGLPQYHVHVSGHIMPLQLRNILGELDAEKIFPVHTEHADLFAGLMRDWKERVCLPERGKEYVLS
ncbi:MAG: MBL fold metallo-hydrolase [Candidatus Bathyarchaeota archaeon]|nr:MBL fold metallo-hydrolase [Candidatus Bathyarchaeota archaeon]